MVLLNDIERYRITEDPELCEDIVMQIDIFNDKCEPTVEILDCS